MASAPVVRFVESRMVSTQIAPHVIRGLALPVFDADNPAHQRVGGLCKEGHDAVQNVGGDLGAIQRLLDAEVARVFRDSDTAK